ncbi:hypothetical protein SARC_15289, partial [Sphaeroforma arctica JP610]
DVVKFQIYIDDMAGFPEMNKAYCEIMGDDPPARITVGQAKLALGAQVEIDGIAYLPRK